MLNADPPATHPPSLPDLVCLSPRISVVSKLVGADKPPAGTRSKLLLDNGTEISSSEQFVTKKSHKQ